MSICAKQLKESRSRCFSCIVYQHPVEFLSQVPCIVHWSYILHNEDLNEDGTKKEEHYHLVVTTKDAKTESAFHKQLTKASNQNVLLEDCTHRLGECFLYLTHESPSALRDGKHRYPKAEICCDDIAFWNQKVKESKSQEIQYLSNEQFVRDLLLNYSPIRMGLKYGRDFMKNIEKYEAFAVQVIKELGGTIDENTLQTFVDEITN